MLRLVLLALAVVGAFGADHVFQRGAKVPMYVNKVGPYFNTHETYHYYSLPVCRPNKVVFRSLTLGEVLDGDRMAESLYDIRFKEDVKEQTLCTVSLNAGDIEKLHDAIEDLYYFEFIIDDLPVRGFVGQLVEHVLPHAHEVFLWNHIDFVIDYNGDQIVGVNLSQTSKELLLPEVEDLAAGGDAAAAAAVAVPATFTYSVTWRENTAVSFAHRTHKPNSFFPRTLEIHWLAIINSVVLILLLSGFVLIFLARMLNKDFATSASGVDDDLGLESDAHEDQGWKVVHADVFRFPPFKSLLCAVVGNGAQFLALALLLILLALAGFFNVHRHGSMNTAAVVVYALTCFVAGFVANRLYCALDGPNWAWNVVLTASLFALPFFLVWSVVNAVAWWLGSTQALPATTVLLLLLVWLVVGFPLTVVGGITGRRLAAPFAAPCRTKHICREIPAVPAHRGAAVQCAVGGFLPFSAVSVELYYIFATIWGREQYTLYGILLLVFLVLVAVTVCISVTATYFQLGVEDYRWWWRSVFTAGFSGVYVLGYAVFFFLYRSNMSGVLQTVQFFGYTTLVCYVFFLTLGTVGFLSSLAFVRFIYRNLKLD